MFSKELIILNEDGLHARILAKFVSCANEFSSDINVEYARHGLVDGKSFLMLSSLAIPQNACIRITAVGKDEELAINTLVELMNNQWLTHKKREIAYPMLDFLRKYRTVL